LRANSMVPSATPNSLETGLVFEYFDDAGPPIQIPQSIVSAAANLEEGNIEIVVVEDPDYVSINVPDHTPVTHNQRRPSHHIKSQTTRNRLSMDDFDTQDIGRTLSMLGSGDDKSSLPIGVGCIIFDDVMYQTPDGRRCFDRCVGLGRSSAKWTLRGVGGFMEAGKVTMLLGARPRSGHDELLRIIGQQPMEGASYGKLRWNYSDFTPQLFRKVGAYICKEEYQCAFTCVTACVCSDCYLRHVHVIAIAMPSVMSL